MVKTTCCSCRGLWVLEPSIYTAVYNPVNSSSGESDTFWPLQVLHADSVLTHVQAKHVQIKLKHKAPAGGTMTSPLCPTHTAD